MITAVGLEAILRAVDPKRLEKLLSQLIQRVVLTIEANTKATTPVLTGNLRRSIHGEVISVSRGRVGTNVIYAPIVHRRNPYLDRGLAASSSTIDALLKDAGVQWSAGTAA